MKKMYGSMTALHEAKIMRTLARHEITRREKFGQDTTKEIVRLHRLEHIIDQLEEYEKEEK